MARSVSNDRDADLIAFFAGRLERLARLQSALRPAGRAESPAARLVHAAMRSTLVDLARLGQAELGAAVVARARPNRARRPTDAIRRLLGSEQASEDPATRPTS